MKFEERIKKAERDWKELREKAELIIWIGTATCGRSAGSLSLLQICREELKKRKIRGRVVEVGCMGLCYAEPLAIVEKPPSPGICYGFLTPERIKEIFQSHWEKNHIPKEYALGTLGGEVEGIPPLSQHPMLKPQVRRILRNCGFINPTNIDHYLARGGYQGFIKALREGPLKVIEELRISGLRGRGGAGFPTWKKWEICREARGEEKVVICNADEGDPGAFMDRALIEGDPHAVLEGLLIAGFTVGADKGYVYCRAEYPLALERLGRAIRQMERLGLLGERILDTEFSFHIEVKEGAGAFVCGEETALIASIEGRRGMPRPRPPYPVERGLWNKPTLINNVETLASVSLILQKGGEWFARLGTERSKGTKIFALAGKVSRTGLIEVPLGMTLREIIFDIGGGIFGGRKFKAVQTGGPSGGCIPASLLDRPVDYESLKELGSIMGSGGMIVMDEDTCMVEVARYFLEFTQKESCGKCVPCRLGTKQMLDILEDITRGKGREEDIDLLMEIGEVVRVGSLCGLGQTAPNPVLTTLRYFREEYESHIRDKKCPAGVCERKMASSPSPTKS